MARRHGRDAASICLGHFPVGSNHNGLSQLDMRLALMPPRRSGSKATFEEGPLGTKRTLGDLPTSVNCHADMRQAPTRVTKLGFSAVEDCESYSDARPFEAASKKGKTR